MLKCDFARGGLVGLSLGLAVSLSAVPSLAKDAAAAADSKAKKKVLVGGFDGPKSDQARKAVIAALKEDGAYDVVEVNSVKPGGTDKGYAAASAGASAVLVGSVKKTGLTLSVRNGADGALVQDVEVKGDSPGKLEKNIEDSLGLSVADPIAQTKPGTGGDAGAPAKEEEEEEAPADEQAAAPAASDDATDDSGPSPLEIEAGLRALNRSFDYHDTPAQLYPSNGLSAPPTYELPLGPAVFINATVYPGAFISRGPIGWIGLTGSYELNFATKSVYAEGTPNQGELTTKSSQTFIGLKGRVPVKAHEFALVAGYGQHVFNLLGDEGNPQVPDVFYKYARVSAEGRLRFDAISVGFHLGTRFVFRTGGLERDWYPGHTKTQAIEGGVNVGYRVVKGLDVLVGFDWIRYAFDFNPVDAMNSRVVAGGASDQYLSGFLGLRYALPGFSGK